LFVFGLCGNNRIVFWALLADNLPSIHLDGIKHRVLISRVYIVGYPFWNTSYRTVHKCWYISVSFITMWKDAVTLLLINLIQFIQISKGESCIVLYIEIFRSLGISIGLSHGQIWLAFSSNRLIRWNCMFRTLGAQVIVTNPISFLVCVKVSLWKTFKTGLNCGVH
jgi:hypothetical protein